MEELLVKVAEILDISVESVITYYPVLRTQMIWYNSLSTIWGLSLAFLMFTPLLILLGGLILDIMKEHDKISDKKKFFKTVGVLMLLFGIIMITSSIARNILAQDLILIKSFL